MTPSPYRPTVLTWLALCALTLAVTTLGTASALHLATLALAAAWLKGVLVADGFMALRRAPLWLRGTVHGWLAVVCAALMLSFN